MTGPDQERKIDAIAANMVRLARRRNAGYQRVDPSELRETLRAITAAFVSAVDSGRSAELTEIVEKIARRRLQQGLHAVEIFGAWQEIRWAVEVSFPDAMSAPSILDDCEERLVHVLRAGIPSGTPQAWPSQEVEVLRKTLERATVAVDLIASSGQRQLGGRPGALLTVREREALSLAATGMTIERLANRLGVSTGTARTYLSRAIDKLGAENRVHAVAVAVSRGLITLPTEDEAGG